MNVQQGEGLPMRRTSMWLVALWIGVCSASGQEATSTDDVRKGHRLAIMVCAFCHVAAPDQAHMPILNPPAPSFDSTAQRTDISAEWLEKFITTTHRGLDEQRQPKAQTCGCAQPPSCYPRARANPASC